MTLGERGEVFVGTETGKLYRVRDPDMKGEAQSVEVIRSGMSQPNGVAYKDGSLYVAERSRLSLFPQVDQKNSRTLKAEILPQQIPSQSSNSLKYIRFGPEDALYISVGADCNLCIPKKNFAKIYRLDLKANPRGKVNGKVLPLEIAAQGVRYSLGFDWDAKNKDMWFTDTGRDGISETLPPDEINKLMKNGEDFGFPFCYGQSVPDPKFKKSCEKVIPSQLDLPAHLSVQGMRFYSDKIFPRSFQNQILMAEHGSASRKQVQGYRVSQVRIKAGAALLYQPWIEGWVAPPKKNQRLGKPWGRPVDVEIYFDGSVLISDDLAGVIYRVSYSELKSE